VHIVNTMLTITTTTMRIRINVAKKDTPQGAGTCLSDISVNNDEISNGRSR